MDYEGRCQFCKRDIGTGHEPGCPYYLPRVRRAAVTLDAVIDTVDAALLAFAAACLTPWLPVAAGLLTGAPWALALCP